MLSLSPRSPEENAVRIPEIFSGDGVVAFSKPAGIEEFSEALRRQITEEKPSALAIGLAKPQLVYSAETECSGIIIFADKGTGALETWRNALGSSQLLFKFIFLAEPTEDTENEFMCDLPVAKHFSEPRALVSHNTGKKSETIFRRLEKFGKRELWQAETYFPRQHQIRLHATECGIPIVGENLYASVPAVLISELRPRGRLNKGEDKPFYPQLCIHLAEISVCNGSALPDLSITAPLPSGFDALLKKLRIRSA